MNLRWLNWIYKGKHNFTNLMLQLTRRSFFPKKLVIKSSSLWKKIISIHNTKKKDYRMVKPSTIWYTSHLPLKFKKIEYFCQDLC